MPPAATLGPATRALMDAPCHRSGPVLSHRPSAHEHHASAFAKGPARRTLFSVVYRAEAPKERRLERAKGIEPSYAAWEAAVLPLNYARAGRILRYNARRPETGSKKAVYRCVTTVPLVATPNRWRDRLSINLSYPGCRSRAC